MERLQLFFKDLLQTVVIVKGSFDVLPTGETRPCAEQPLVLLEDTQTPYGSVEAEIVPVKAWCDVAVLGHAQVPAGVNPTQSLLVSLRVGDFGRVLRVTGDRRWVKSLGALIPSDPVPFTKMPLTNERAFGGKARVKDQLEGFYFDNPVGRGYVALEEHAEGTMLPNIEEPDQPIKAWSDTPVPAGVGPLSRQSMTRAQRGVNLDVERRLVRMDPHMFCFAHPRMAMPTYPVGAEVTLDGVSAKGRWSFRLPALSAWIRVELGDFRYQLPIVPDTLYILPDEERVTVVGRRTFLYQFLPERRRAVRVMSAPDATAARTPTSIRELRASPRPGVPLEAPPSSSFNFTLEHMMLHYPFMDVLETFPLCPSG
jgi:hypothetical protein